MTTVKDMENALNKVLEIASEDGPYAIFPELFAELTKSPRKCLFCKHKKDEALIKPSKDFNPSAKWMFHFKDTHGYEPEVMTEWLFAFPYVHKETSEPLIKNPRIVGVVL